MPLYATRDLVNHTTERLIGPIVNFKIMASPLHERWVEGQPLPQDALLERYRMVVSVAKRPLVDWERLTIIGVEHVGIMVTLLSPALMQVAAGLARPQLPCHTFDFLPLKGDTSKFGGRVAAQVRHNQFAPRDWAIVGWSDKRLRDIIEFNRSFNRVYHLGHNDCRNYASAAIEFLTGHQISPGMLSWFINTSRYRRLSGEDMFAHVAAHARKTSSPNYRIQLRREMSPGVSLPRREVPSRGVMLA